MYIGFGCNYNKSYNVSSKYFLLDSGSNYIVLTKEIEDQFIDWFMGQWIRQGYCYKDKGYYYFCTEVDYDVFPPVFFVISGVAYKIEGKDLFWKGHQVSQNYIQLRILFNNQANDQWILGQPFLEKYHAVYNMEEKILGFSRGMRHNVTVYKKTVDHFNRAEFDEYSYGFSDSVFLYSFYPQFKKEVEKQTNSRYDHEDNRPIYILPQNFDFVSRKDKYP